MTTRDQRLPHLIDSLFLTDGGLETSLIYDQGVDLPDFMAIALMRTESGRAALRSYFEAYPPLAAAARTGLVLETPTWRASPDWAAAIDATQGELDAANSDAVALVMSVRDRYERPDAPIAVSGCVGPRGDGYVVGEAMDVPASRAYHARQIGVFAESGVDLVSALTMTYPAEATGVVLAARDAGLPVVISFTVETDGRLPSGHGLGDAVGEVDDATSGYPAYFMINCAHPDHFADILSEEAAWSRRIRGLRANASRRSHAELDAATELDAGDPVELADSYAQLHGRLPWLQVFGGCCGTNAEHVEAVGRRLAAVG